ncbi:hypothetical protein AVEN_211266-1 [Araneus ventricosus]|uniref:IGFBP N-terminal domain-containing protein n=1 Tax=Araneus ventricosus TaxID=182803 RepID=A0A4Y2NKZ0_ARAVE|nr:hypothetical protein AVEN_211266-1 [Araneus ventricosus]
MNKFVVFILLCMLITINGQLTNLCPPCPDVAGQKRYCVRTRVINVQVCVAGSPRGGRCSSTPNANGVYDGLPPCQAGLTCSATMNGRCE